MSKKTLLEESTVRKFMKLANLEPLSDKFIKEELGYTEEEDMGMDAGGDEMAPVDAMGDMGGDEEGELEVDLDDAGAEGEVSPEVAKKVVQAVLDALGVQGTVEDDEDMGGADDMGDMDDFGGEEEAGEGEEEAGEEDFGGEEDEGEEEELDEEYEAKENLEEKKDEEEEEMDESTTLSEDDLVENVLRRVTARLLAEAKAKKDKKDIKSKMKDKKAKKAEKEEKLDEEKHVVTHKKSSNVIKKGTNKHNVYKGHPDMEMKPLKGKGGKTGKGGHEMESLKSTQKHTVTHDKTSKVAGKGGNKA